LKYQVIRELHQSKHYSIQAMCRYLHVARSAYYRWLKQPISPKEVQDREIGEKIREIHENHGEKGYRGIRDCLYRDYGIKLNDKKVLRLCRQLQIQSTIKHRGNSITRHAQKPYHTAKNYLNREFHADKPNEKWCTDVTELKYYKGSEKKKLYLSAILDLYDRRIVSFEISDRNDNPLVMNTLDKALKRNPNAHPLFHSDRGFQYTSKQFCIKLREAGMKQSMSRVARCIDNGPMEGFWGILKRENYYGKRFTSRESLVCMIEEYIYYYNNRRYQRKLHILSPMQFHQHYLEAA
jgi:transposase InsO family protein